MANIPPDGTQEPPEDPPDGPDRKKSPTFSQTFAFVTALAGLVAVVFTWNALPGRVPKGFAVAGIAFACYLLARIAQALISRKLNWRWVADLAAVGGLGACAAVVAGARPASSLQIIRFIGDRTPALCQPYQGTGTIPKGYDLLIFDKPPGGYWYLEGLAHNQPGGGWISPDIHIDSNPMFISASLVPANVGDFLKHKIILYSTKKPIENGIRHKALGLAWLSPTLPHSAEEIKPITVRPTADPGRCS